MILLDTNALIWLVLEPEKLSAPSRDALLSAARTGAPIVTSVVSLWEIAQLVSKRRFTIHISLDNLLGKIEAAHPPLPLSRQIIVRAAEFRAPFPKDPMDRLIASTALCSDCTLITADSKIRAAKVCRTLW